MKVRFLTVNSMFTERAENVVMKSDAALKKTKEFVEPSNSFGDYKLLYLFLLGQICRGY